MRLQRAERPRDKARAVHMGRARRSSLGRAPGTGRESGRDSAQPALRCGADARRTASAPRHTASHSNSRSPQPLRCLAQSRPGQEWKGRKERKKAAAASPARGGPAVPSGGGAAATPPPPLPPATSGGATKIPGRRQRRRCGWSSLETVAPTTSLAGTSAGAGAWRRHGGCSRLCPPGREGGGWRSREAKRSRWHRSAHARSARPRGRSFPACRALARCTLGCVVLWAFEMAADATAGSNAQLSVCNHFRPFRRPPQPSVTLAKPGRNVGKSVSLIYTFFGSTWVKKNGVVKL